MNTVEEQRITPAEWSRKTGRWPECIPAEMLAPDWAGHPSITLAEARQLQAQFLEDDRKRELQNDWYGAYRADREKRRSEAGRNGALRASRPVKKRRYNYDIEGMLPVVFDDPNEAMERGRVMTQAYGQAIASFDAREPLMDLAQWLQSKDGRAYR
jgi:hypothetical protein